MLLIEPMFLQIYPIGIYKNVLMYNYKKNNFMGTIGSF